MVTYETLGVRRVINASGKMTSLGASVLDPRVTEAMRLASQSNVPIEELQDAASLAIARATGAEAGMMTCGAGAGIALAVAACIAGDDSWRIRQLPLARGIAKREVLLQLGHAVDFGAPITQMIEVGGGLPVLLGAANHTLASELASAIGPNTAAFVYVKSHHAVQRGMLSLAQCIAICRAKSLPVIVDAAAEEDLKAYVAAGADLVCYSGGKAIGGPTCGMVCGRRDLIKACRAQSAGIGRAMKVGKEEIVGFLQALELYTGADQLSRRELERQMVGNLVAGLDGLPGLQASIAADEAGRGIQRAQIKLDEAALGFTALDLVRELERGEPPIFTRNHQANLGILAFDPRPLKTEDVEVIVRRVREAHAKLSGRRVPQE